MMLGSGDGASITTGSTRWRTQFIEVKRTSQASTHYQADGACYSARAPARQWTSERPSRDRLHSRHHPGPRNADHRPHPTRP